MSLTPATTHTAVLLLLLSITHTPRGQSRCCCCHARLTCRSCTTYVDAPFCSRFCKEHDVFCLDPLPAAPFYSRPPVEHAFFFFLLFSLFLNPQTWQMSSIHSKQGDIPRERPIRPEQREGRKKVICEVFGREVRWSARGRRNVYVYVLVQANVKK